ncbi:MAG: tolB [Gammaproteobacteria bacterium]|jgi:TolB protein|nr:tolB [Gammaproteobacteria bacterium]
MQYLVKYHSYAGRALARCFTRTATKYLLALITFFSVASQAALEIQLTRGVEGSLPIAIVPFAGQNPNSQSPNDIANVISNDLKNSGRFRVVPGQAGPSTAEQVDFQHWQQQGVDNIVVGNVTPTGSGNYRVQFQLLSAYPNKANDQLGSSAPVWQKTIILNQNFSGKDNQLRALAHHISDLIYENLTGERGVFSTRIAYVVAQQSPKAPSVYTLEVSDIDGYGPQPLLKSNEPIMSPKWSPDGRRLTYVSFEKDNPIVYVQDVATGRRQVVSNSSGLNSAPSWSPDGNRLALVLTKTGAPKIFVMDLNTNTSMQVTDGAAIDTEPVWSADGRSILFTSNRGGNPQVYRVDLSSKAVQRVTFQGNYNASPSLSPNGQVLAVLHGGENGFNVGVQDMSSGRFNVVTRSGGTQAPSIAPNGRMIVYAMGATGRGVLGMVSSDGRVTLVLPSREGDVREPAWGPFANKPV